VIKIEIVRITLRGDLPATNEFYERFIQQDVLGKLEKLDAKIRRNGLGGLRTKRDILLRIGTESDKQGNVTKSGYGVFNLPWLAADHPEWAASVLTEVEGICNAIRTAHGRSVRFVIWAGMGGSAEDKSAYNTLGLLRRGPRFYVLDSADPAKLKAILEDAQKKSKESLRDVLKGTLVIGMAMGMTSYEPVVNLQALARLYDLHKLASNAHFCYMTLPGSLLDKFGKERGHRRVELQLDGANSTAGRHSAPMTRGSLYPLALAGRNRESRDLESWIEAAQLNDEEIHLAFRLGSFLHAQALEGREKVTLLLPKELEGLAMWTKQAFEESLGKSEEVGLKIVIGEPGRLADYRPAKDVRQDRVFLRVCAGRNVRHEQTCSVLVKAGHAFATLSLDAARPLSSYQQFVHYTVFALAYLRNMNFVTQPSVELYKSITNRLFAEGEKAGGIRKTAAWRLLETTSRRATYRGRVTLVYEHLPDHLAADGASPKKPSSERLGPAIYADIISKVIRNSEVEYFELTFFGDIRYTASGRKLAGVLEKAGARLFRRRLKMPFDLAEGPAMNHSYHEMIIGHGRCFSTVLLSLKQEELKSVSHTAEYHQAQFLATQMALAQRNRLVVALFVKDLSTTSQEALADFFAEAEKHLAKN
jgi:glucose-6-phosphate isomerase